MNHVVLNSVVMLSSVLQMKNRFHVQNALHLCLVHNHQKKFAHHSNYQNLTLNALLQNLVLCQQHALMVKVDAQKLQNQNVNIMELNKLLKKNQLMI